jgi:hypothetical protein
MNLPIGHTRRSDHSIQQTQFKTSMATLSTAVVSIVQLLSLPPQQVTPFALGSRLAHLLISLRQHRSHAVALGAIGADAKLIVTYSSRLGELRASVAQWLTIHAAKPSSIYVEISDFETQAWSTLGMGMVMLDGLGEEELFLDSVMSSRFHVWWEKMNTRPAGLMT